MLRMTLQSVRAHLTRMALSLLAIALGVGFLASGLIFSDGLQEAALAQAGQLDRHTDVELSTDHEDGLDSALVDTVQQVAGVAVAEGDLVGWGIGLAGESGVVPGYHTVVTVPTDPRLRSYEVSEGRLPDRPGEAVLDHRTAQRRDLRVGQMIRVSDGETAAHRFTLVGLVDVAGTRVDSGGATVGLLLPDVVELMGARSYQRIIVAAEPTVAPETLVDRVGTVVGQEVILRTHAELLAAEQDRVVGDGQQFSTMLLAFALVTVFVAGFVIANTFAIVIAQRTRDLALLRLVGASRGQVFRSVLVEAVVVGAIGSGLGLLAGVVLVAGLRRLYGAVGSGMDIGMVVSPTTVVTALVCGIGVTVVAAMLPVWRGTRVPPVAALTDAAVHPGRRPSPIRLIFGMLWSAFGAAALLAAGRLSNFELAVLVMVAGGCLLFLGMVAVSPWLVPALIRLMGAPLVRFGGVTARIAVADSLRSPRRVAVTAMAMVIGIGLVTMFAAGASSLKQGVQRQVDARVAAAFLLTSDVDPVPSAMLQRLRELPELEVVHAQYETSDHGHTVRSAHPVLLAKIPRPVVGGEVDRLAPGTVVVTEASGAAVGDRLSLQGGPATVVAVLADRPGDDPEGLPVWLLESDFIDRYGPSDTFTVELEPAGDLAAARAAVEHEVLEFPTVQLQDLAAYRDAQTAVVDAVLAAVTALLALAILISLVGVANTLTLSVVERSGEHGLLRALGLSRGQLRGMLAMEAGLLALVGVVCGVGMGLVACGTALAVLNTANHGKLFQVTLPTGQVVVLLLVSVGAALLASVLPARRAARRPVVDVLATE